MSVSRREKVLAFGALGVCALLLLDQYVLTPVFEQQDFLDTQRTQIATEIARSNQLRTESKQLAPKWAALLSDPSASEGQVLHALDDWARACGCALTVLKPERLESKEPLKEIQVQATGTGSMEVIAKLLLKIHAAPFPLKITELQISSRTDGSSELSLQMKLSTLYRAPEAKAAPAKTVAGGGT